MPRAAASFACPPRAGTVRAGRSVAAHGLLVRAETHAHLHTKPRALRAVVPVMAPAATQGDAQRLHARTSTAHAVELPGLLTASRPSPDASNRHQFRQRLQTVLGIKPGECLHLDCTEAERQSAYSLMTVCGRRLRSLGETWLARNLTPASHHNGCERFKPVWDSLAKVRPAWACRRKAHLHRRSSCARRQVFDASGGKCAYCDTALQLDGKWHIDHRMPRALMGSDEPTNLTAACVPCNLAKRDRTDIEFRSERAA